MLAFNMFIDIGVLLLPTKTKLVHDFSSSKKLETNIIAFPELY